MFSIEYIKKLKRRIVDRIWKEEDEEWVKALGKILNVNLDKEDDSNKPKQ